MEENRLIIFILQIKSDAEEELNESVSHLVREWAENTMPGTKFGSLQELAAHLIDKMYVDTRSKSAYSVIAAIQKKTIRPPEASGTYSKEAPNSTYREQETYFECYLLH